MHCSFLLKTGNESEYSYFVIENESDKQCPQNMVALHYWMNRHEHLGITASNFNQKVKEHSLSIEVFCKFFHMVSVVEQQYIIRQVEPSKGMKTIIAEHGKATMEVNPLLRG